ncbi:DUF998 domain-containing protein, partial [Thermodesulfobacteriota bacterium]
MNYPPTEMAQLYFKFFLAVLLVGTIGDLFIPVLIGFEYPGYSHFYHTISSLGTNVSPVKIFQCINLVIVGVLLIVFSFGQYRQFHSINWANRLYFIGIILFGIGCILAGFFPEDPIGVDETVSGKVHGIASGIGFLFLILNPLWAIWIKEFQVLRRYHVFTLFFALLTFILFIISEDKDYGIFKYTGLLQRLNLVTLYGHMIICFITS